MVRRIFATTLGVVALSLAALTPALMAPPAGAAPAMPAAVRPTPVTSAIVGRLGIEGGAYPGRFRPTAGRVLVAFQNPPLVLTQSVGPTGRFQIPLAPGTYTLTGCSQSGQCGRPKTVTLHADQIRHVRLIWAYVP